MLRSRSVIALLLLVGVALVFGGVREYGFIDFDDSEYVYANPVVRQGLTPSGIAWAFSLSAYASWHPITWMSHMADVQLFGLHAGLHHVVNVVLHGLNTVLLFLVLSGMTGAIWRSALVAALFGVHPLHVESVAWVSERKDVLSTMFWFLTLAAYGRYAKAPTAGRYAATLLFFVLGLLSKPMLVVVPLTLLLLDYWPLERLRGDKLGRLLVEKLPFFALAAAVSLITYSAQARWEAMWSAEALPLGARIANAIVSTTAYLEKTVAPVSLAAFYPHPASLGRSVPTGNVVGSLLVLVAISGVVGWQFRRRPYLVVGWSWYLLSLAPVLGFVQVGSQAMADRYTYVPLVGVFLAVVWGIADVVPGRRIARVAVATVATTVVAILALLAVRQVGYWRDATTLYTHAIRVTADNWLAWNNLGMQYLEARQPEVALACFRKAASIRPDYSHAWHNAGVAQTQLGQLPAALASYERALDLDPDNADGWLNLGLVRDSLGDRPRALEAYQSALRLRPTDARAIYASVLAYAAAGDAARAAALAARLRSVDPARWTDLMSRLQSGPGQSGPGLADEGRRPPERR
ncbi:MAG TPA: tetratricopeptide repeat protein [Methylomirabilota bacterium]|nr:tetratricopeptide repeat protein [Methylomirabilota bacterium]